MYLNNKNRLYIYKKKMKKIILLFAMMMIFNIVNAQQKSKQINKKAPSAGKIMAMTFELYYMGQSMPGDLPQLVFNDITTNEEYDFGSSPNNLNGIEFSDGDRANPKYLNKIFIVEAKQEIIEIYVNTGFESAEKRNSKAWVIKSIKLWNNKKE